MQKQKMKHIIFYVPFISVGLFFLALYVFSETSDADIRYSVTSSATDVPVLTFWQNTIDYNRMPFHGLYFLEVWPNNPHKFKTVWSLIEDPPTPRRTLQSITYGNCPYGYRIIHAAEPLQAGHYYRFNMSEVFKKVKPLTYIVVPQGPFNSL